MRRPPASELFAWALVGAVVGVAAGFAFGEFYGPAARRRLSRLAHPALPDDGQPVVPPLRRRDLERAVRAALAADPELHRLDLEPLAVGPGVVELHGWVPSRALRARAVRVVRQVAGLESFVNRILVEGEDGPPAPAGDLADQPA